MTKEYEMSIIGEVKFFLGLQILQQKTKIFISQCKYVKQALKKFGMDYSKPVGTPMVTSCDMTKDDDSNNSNKIIYKSMTNGLQYTIHTRPDISNVVGILDRFQAEHEESHVLSRGYSNI